MQKDLISFDKSTDRFSTNFNYLSSSQMNHLSSNPHEDTFLVESDSKYQDSQLQILCESHKSQAVFFSNQQQKYKCFKCLLQEQDLIYIDKKFKKEMEEYERIKRMAADAITSNNTKMNGMKSWKNEIRKILMDVRSQFQRWVDVFTNQFILSLKDIENSKDLKEFIGEDRRLNQQLEALRDKYVQIMKIFTLISNATADQKVVVIEQNRNQMNALEAEIRKQDAYIVKQSMKMRDAQNKTVSLEGLSNKIGLKYVQHFEKKLNKLKQGSSNKQANESIATINHSQLGPSTNKYSSQVSNLGSKSQLHTSTISQSTAQKSTIKNSMPQIESSSRSQTVTNQQQFQQQSQNSSRGQDQRQTTALSKQQQQQQQLNVEQYMARQNPTNLKDTIDLDISEIRQYNGQGGQGFVDPSLSMIPEIMENTTSTRNNQQEQNSNNNLKSSRVKQEQQKQQDFEEEKKPKDRVKADTKSNKDSIASSSNKQEKQDINQSTVNLIDQSSVSYRYRHKNQNSIYYLKPRTNEIYLLDFKIQGFVKEQVHGQTLIPTGSSSIQNQSGNIYMIGGQSQDGQVSKSCWEIDTNMNMSEKAPMKQGRFSIAIALMFDKFIFAIGGATGKGSKAQASDQVEMYDTSINVWYPVGSLNKARSCTSACILSHRYVYVFPGLQTTSWNTIEFIDIGHSIDPKEIKKAKWNLVTISNSDFNNTFSYGSIPLNSTEILIFGGSKMNSFILDSAIILKLLSQKKDLKKVTAESEAILKSMPNSKLCVDAWFSYDCDYIARIYGNYLYAVDQHAGNLHVYSMKDKIWNYSSLKELGVLN
ncbi:kelch motif family protein [Stylonychia lemnae]|uniref:Kelch motif family protein n=1 Tax=Stylonychia lemnae TaxID=5949 RepID=A0A078A783_STYLE|nr:kelch motif family protein [Stylonychia lemnae]|eukprot:CDW76656.1 kelch motif family protein [Stylonychia lemnae]